VSAENQLKTDLARPLFARKKSAAEFCFILQLVKKKLSGAYNP